MATRRIITCLVWALASTAGCNGGSDADAQDLVELGPGIYGHEPAQSQPLPDGVIAQEVVPHDDGAAIELDKDDSQLAVRYAITTGSTWVTLRATKSSFMVALGRNGWGFDRTAINGDWRFGWVNGSSTSPVTGCLWLQANQLNGPTGGTPTADCSSAPQSLRESQYMAFFNGNRLRSQFPDGNCTDDWKCDGSPRRIDPARCPGGAPVYSNVRPWLPNPPHAPGTDVMYWVPAGQYVLWRYVTSDGRFSVMRYTGPRQSPTSSAGAQDWGFIPAYCISNYGYVEGPRN
jgi:hypothetical protein